MTIPSHERSELRALLDALCEESITPEQVQRLEELVLTYPEAEACYVQTMSLQADLVAHFSVLPARTEQSLQTRLEPGTTEPAALQQRQPGSRWTWRLWGAFGLAALAASLLLTLAPGLRWFGIRGPEETASEAFDDTVAVLLQAPEAQWETTGLRTRPGAPLRRGWLRLKSGLAHLEFYSGAMVILEGPAEIELLSPTEAYCTRGKLRATVPPQAQGFTIRTPQLDLVDRGTEFGLRVGGKGNTEVHVFHGKVELYDPGSSGAGLEGKALTTGQGLQLDGPGAVRGIEPDPAAFKTAQELAVLSKAELQRRQQEWAMASAAARRDPSVALYYPFQPEQPWSRTLLDQAQGRQQPRDGAIVGSSWVTGRWPGKQGLEFKRVSDRVRIHVPGSFESVTLAAWVRIDALPNKNNSLLMADGWSVGGLHWQIGDDGTIILAVKAPGNTPNAHYHAPAAFGPERFGRWSHLAVVYDRTAGLVTHYLDGRPVAELPVQFDIPLRLGDAQVGNWVPSSSGSKVPIRFLTGCMDELIMYSRALTGREIEQLYADGQPPG
jgi:hypothetical protein